MKDWQLDFKWLQVRHYLKDTFKKETLPDLNAVLLLIGIQELGLPQYKFTKEEKQDLMHIAVCRLLIPAGFYEFEGLDHDGWPHYKLLKPVPIIGVKPQEEMLKEKVVQYFKEERLGDRNEN